MNTTSKNQIKNSAVIVLCMGLCACTTTSETFDCPAGKGVGCKSISEVNQMVNQGMLGEGFQELQPVSAPPAFTKSPPSSDAEFSASEGLSVHRVQEEHLRVWIAPFQDAQGNFHEGSIVHTVVRPGFWQITDSAVLSSYSGTQTSEPRVPDSHGDGEGHS